MSWGNKLYKTGAHHWICGIRHRLELPGQSMCSNEWGKTHKWQCHPCGFWHHSSASPCAQPCSVLVLWVLMACTKHNKVSSNTISHKESLRLVGVKVLYLTQPFDSQFVLPNTTWLKTNKQPSIRHKQLQQNIYFIFPLKTTYSDRWQPGTIQKPAAYIMHYINIYFNSKEP